MSNSFINDICSDVYYYDKDRCPFQGIGNCVDKVAKICNKHASYFSLMFKSITYENAENESWSDIVTYMTGTKMFSLPLFTDPVTGELSVDDVKNYLITVASQHPEMKVHFVDMLQRMCSLLGINIINTNIMSPDDWLNDARLFVSQNSGAVFYEGANLPPFYKMLFKHMIPSFIKNKTNNDVNICIENIGLVEKDGKYIFQTLNPAAVLKYINRDSIATPLVLAAYREVSPAPLSGRTFTPGTC